MEAEEDQRSKEEMKVNLEGLDEDGKYLI